jgi:enoyl-[acyl-carrier-protein] reductase (NADH)
MAGQDTSSSRTGAARSTAGSGPAAAVAAFLLSDLAAGVTAEITYVDAGFSKVAAAIEA